jgi:methyl-accepting chemotaxis protein
MKKLLVKIHIQEASLAKKITLLMVGIVVVPLLLVGTIATISSSNAVINKTEVSMLSTTIQTGKYIDQILENIMDISQQFLSNEITQKYFSPVSSADELERYSLRLNVSKILRNIPIAYNYICGVYVLTDQETSMSYPEVDTKKINFSALKKSKWYKQIMESPNKTTWLNDHAENFDDTMKKNNISMPDYVISLGRAFVDVGTADFIGVVLVDINSTVFRDILSSVKLSAGSKLLVLTPAGEVITPEGQVDKSKLGKDIFNKVISLSSRKESGIFTIDEKKENNLVCYYKSPDTNFTYIGIVPLQDLTIDAKKLRNIIIVMTIMFVFLAIGIGALFTFNIVRDITKVLKVISNITAGKLTCECSINRKDEIGNIANSINDMLESLRSLIVQGKELANEVNRSSSTISIAAGEINTATKEIAKAIQDIASGAGDQANEVSLITQKVNMFGNRITEIVEDYGVIHDLSNKLTYITNRGIEKVGQLMQTYGQTSNSTKWLIDNVKELQEYSKSISKITNLLKTLTEQTKLVSLNATIEAAKAGEVGRGFAVVAQEIKKLSSQAMNSTKEIEGIITKVLNITQKAENIVNEVEKTFSVLTKSIEEVRDSFIYINNRTKELDGKVNMIFETVVEINKEKNEIYSGIENISSVTEETAAATQEVSASVEELLANIEELSTMSKVLKDMSDKLNMIVNKFVTG